ncbi:MAG: phosphatase PAP2 family protein [Clostridia bacterium]
MTILKIDQYILAFIQTNMHSHFFDQLMPLISRLGDAGLLWIIIAFTLIITKRYRKTGFMLAFALFLCLLIGNLTLKPLFARPRPFLLDPTIMLLIPAPSDYSFPSGHSMSAFAAATVLFSIHPRWVLAYFLAGCIAFSRLYLLVHYPSDVLAGALIGILIGLFTIYTANFLLKSNPPQAD